MYEIHEAANAFPMMTDAEIKDLAEDIKRNGQRVPITLYQGKVLDGRNRLKACQMASVQPRTVQYTGTDDPYMWVWSLNAERRHLTSQEQKALIWRKLHGMSEAVQRERERIKAEAAKAMSEAKVGNKNASKELENKSGTDCATVVSAKDHKSRAFEAQAAGVNKGAMQRAQTLERKAPDLAEKVARGELRFSDAQREAKRAELVQQLESVEAREAKAAEGVYDVAVIDPPWPMQKIERDVRTHQVEFDYPTMSESEMAAMELPLADDAHVWLWTTHKFLPMAFRLLDAWDLKYVCLFTWHKPGGFQPFNLPQYNCEFAIYARRGAPTFIDTKQFNVCFAAPRGVHSEKPSEFYDVVRRVTGGRRIDIFNRRKIDGFDGWGKEAAE